MPVRPCMLIWPDRAGMEMPGSTARPALVTSVRALVGDIEAAVARVGATAAREAHGEQTFALDGDVEFALRVLERALCVGAVDGGEAHTASDLDRPERVRAGGADDLHLAHRLIEQVLERGAAPLEGGGVDVGEVVGDHLGARLLGGHPGGGDTKGGIMAVWAGDGSKGSDGLAELARGGLARFVEHADGALEQRARRWMSSTADYGGDRIHVALLHRPLAQRAVGELHRRAITRGDERALRLALEPARPGARGVRRGAC